MPASPRVLTVLVVDDEPHARTGLARMLAARADIAVIGECAGPDDQGEHRGIGLANVRSRLAQL